MTYFPLFSSETLALLMTFLCLVIVYAYWPYGVFEKLGIPGPKPSPFIGSAYEYAKMGILQTDMKYFKTFGRLWGFYECRVPILFTMDPRMIKTILVKECFSYFTNRREFNFNGPLNDAMSNARGEDWKRQRSLLSPLFSSGRIKEMLPLMTQHSDQLVQCLQEVADRDAAVDIRQYFASYCLDAIANVALSIDTESLSKPNDPSVVKIKNVFNFQITNHGFTLLAFFPFLSPLLEKTGLSIFPRAESRFLISTIEKVKLDREKNSERNRMDFLQMMIEAQSPETKHGSNGTKKIKGLTHNQVLSSAAMFLAAGLETTSKALAFLVYNLATNPGVMKTLQDEIDRVFPNKAPVTYESLVQMEYLDMVLNESLRLYPIGIRIERLCTETVVINGVTIPKGTVVMVPVFSLHRDPEFWPEPECFNPERFSKENKGSVDPYTYLPFGVGPRNCIGMRFALLLMKLAIVQVFQNFSLVTGEETEIPLQLDKSFLLGTEKPIQLKIVSREPVMNGE